MRGVQEGGRNEISIIFGYVAHGVTKYNLDNAKVFNGHVSVI